MNQPIGILLLNLGAPSNLDEVAPFLHELFTDPDLYPSKIPNFIKTFIGRRLARARTPHSIEIYRTLGACRRRNSCGEELNSPPLMGGEKGEGGSPLREITEHQAHRLEDYLQQIGISAHVTVGMRYAPPKMSEGLKDLVAKGVSTLIPLPLYPQFSIMTTGSSLKLLHQEVKNYPDLRILPIVEWCGYPPYIQACARRIEKSIRDPGFCLRPPKFSKKLNSPPLMGGDEGEGDFLKLRPSADFNFCHDHPLPNPPPSRGREYEFSDSLLERTTQIYSQTAQSPPNRLGFSRGAPSKTVLLFSAHSLPLRLIESGDPYLRQTLHTCERIAAELKVSIPWRLSFQSRADRSRWLQPTTRDTLRKLAQEGIKKVVLFPVSFVSDHSETLYEIDIQYKKLAKEVGLEEFIRVPAFNDDDDFIAVLASLVQHRLLAHERAGSDFRRT